MTITALPTPPSRNDPGSFSTMADDFFGALPTFVTEANTLASDVTSKQATASTAADSAAADASAVATDLATALAAGLANAASNATAASTGATTATTKAAEAAASAVAASAIVLDVSTGYPVTRPVLNLDFANSKTIDPRITFTRASTATYFGANGLLLSAATDAPRIDHDPVTGECRGLLIEEARTNLLTYSEQFDNAAWVKTRATITPNAAVAPDGTTTADKLVEDATADNSHYLSQAVVHSGAHTAQVYAKAGEVSGLVLLAIGASSFAAGFNLTTGATYAESISGTVPPDLATSITSVGNGWYWCTISFTASSGTSIRINLDKDANGDAIYTGDGTSGLYIWGAQLEAGSFPTSYIPTTTAAATRAADIASMTGANFSSWYRQDEGTFVWAGSVSGTSAFDGPVICTPSDGTNSNRHQFYNTIGSLIVRTSASGSATNNVFSGYSFASDANRSAAFSFGAGKIYTAYLGGTVTETTQAIPSNLSCAYIGGAATGAVTGAQHISRLAYYPKRLSNAELQALSTQ